MKERKKERKEGRKKGRKKERKEERREVQRNTLASVRKNKTLPLQDQERKIREQTLRSAGGTQAGVQLT